MVFNHCKRLIYRGLLYCAALLLTLYLVAPFMSMFFASTSTERELIMAERWLPQTFKFQRYSNLLNFWSATQRASGGDKFRLALKNSFAITSVATMLCLFFGTLAAYAFARFRFRGRNSLILGILITQMLPGASVIIPLYLFLGYLQLRDTHAGLILVYTGFLIPIVIWILRNYFVSIPQEIEEAAIMDGASTAQILYKIMIPLVTPALFATGLFSFITSWNEFFFALILTGSSAKTVPVAITEFSTQGGIDYGMMATAGVIGSIVPIAVALVFKDYITKGLTGGWSK